MLNLLLKESNVSKWTDIEFLGSPLFDFPDLMDLLFTFGINSFFLFIIVKLIYLPANKNKEYLFTFVIFNVVIFLLCNTMGSSKLKEGFAFGLFAILSVLRYRTETIPIKQMSYLFVSITLAVINALLNKKISVAEIILTNSIVAVATYFLEMIWVKSKLLYQMVNYEKIDLIVPEKRAELITDLQNRTGLEVKEIEILKIDLLSDSAQIRIAYEEE